MRPLSADPLLNRRSDGSGCLATPGRQPQAITQGRGAGSGTQSLSEGWAGGSSKLRLLLSSQIGFLLLYPNVHLSERQIAPLHSLPFTPWQRGASRSPADTQKGHNHLMVKPEVK